VLIGSALFAGEPGRTQEAIVLASTISVENSGLLVHILPEFTKEIYTYPIAAPGSASATRAGSACWSKAIRAC
jgi:ABC-type tungstate transport system permease subunit